VLSFAWPNLLPRVRGIAARLGGRYGEARDHLQRAVGLAERLGVLPELARSQLELARLLALHCDGSARDEAVETLRRAAVGLRSIGMRSFYENARALAARLDIGLA
jgi:hypothetical protein